MAITNVKIGTRVQDNKTGQTGIITAQGFVSDGSEARKSSMSIGANVGLNPSAETKPITKGIFSRIQETLNERGSKFKATFKRTAQMEQTPLETGIQVVGGGIGLAGDLAFQSAVGAAETIAPRATTNISQAITEAITGTRIPEVASKIDDWAQEHPRAAANLGGIIDIASIVPVGKAGQVGLKSAKAGIRKGAATAAKAGVAAEKVGAAAKTTAKTAAGIAEDVIPSTQNIISHQVTRALDLTQGDARNILNSTGNEVGEFVARNNLIKESKAETLAAVDDFFKQNFNEVRETITKVEGTYSTGDVPRFKQALQNIKKEITDVPGLEEDNVLVDALLKKKEVSLVDVQRVKELVDEHFSLFRITGDPASGRAKQGVRNMRADLREFIENEVEENLGVDIFDLNNNVATAKGIVKAAEARSTRGLTRSNLQLGDLAVFGVGTGVSGGNFLVGAAAVLGKKILDSPAIKLRFARWIDKLSDARKAKVAKDLTEGRIPKGLPESIKDVLEEDL
tara:strand:+ start:18525 stop:20057 length:1533 start_codon:yes stop_codon:yes gene_type:complete